MNPATRNTMMLVVALLICSALGCQQSARLDWDKPPAVAQGSTPVYVRDLVRREQGGVWGTKPEGEAIGKHTFTVFAIPVGNINADAATPVIKSYEGVLADALRAAGYEPCPATKAPSGSPTLVPELRECYFWSYTWFWPLIMQGGQVTLHLSVEDATKHAVWDKDFKAYSPGASAGGSFGFDDMVRSANSRVAKQIAEECAKDDFRTLIGGKTAASAARP